MVTKKAMEIVNKIKMGIEKGLTHSPTEMNELKKIVLEKKFITGRGSYKEIKGFKDVYISSLILVFLPMGSCTYNIKRPYYLLY